MADNGGMQLPARSVDLLLEEHGSTVEILRSTDYRTFMDGGRADSGNRSGVRKTVRGVSYAR